MADPFDIPNKAYIRSLDPRLFEAFMGVVGGIRNLETQGNFSGMSAPPTPPAVNGLKVTTGPGGEFQLAITDNGQVSRGINYWAEHDTSPDFSNPHIIDMGQSRNYNIHMGAQSLYWRAYSSYPSGQASPYVYHQEQGRPASVLGGVAGTRAPSQGAGTGAPGYGAAGGGPIQSRTPTSGYNWKAQQRGKV